MNLNRYKLKRFHTNDSIHKKIEALFLLYDKRCEDGKLQYKQKIKLLNYFIKTLSDHEEYEMAQAFKDRKLIKQKRYRDDRKDYLHVYARFIRIKLNKFFRKIF